MGGEVHKGIRDILILEREHHLGGILRQCIHDGFGLTRFGETLSGPEYADRFMQKVQALEIPYRTDMTVLDIHTEADGSKTVYAAGKDGYLMLSAKAVILSMGCRERTRARWPSRESGRPASIPPGWPRATSIYGTVCPGGRW